MSIDPARLKLARRAAGLSLRQLEAAIDKRVTAQAIGMYERGEIQPSSEVVLSLAGALQVSVTWLLENNAIELSGVEFRKKKLTRKKEEAQVQAKLIERLERYLELERLLGLETFRWMPPRGAPFSLRALADAETYANQVRSDWALGCEPLPALPDLLEERGLKVFGIELPKAVSALCSTALDSTGAPHYVIAYNQNHPGERQRFSLLHELAHLLLRIPPSIDDEQAADAFAGAFLLPRQLIENEVGRRRSQLLLDELFELKKLFGASVLAITFRLRQLDIISTAEESRLFKEFSRRGYRSPPNFEPHRILEPPPTRFRRLCLRAAAEGVISMGKAAELLGESIHQLRSMASKS
jgi:Zn-dependent peptidase ImmA (M78 family)